MLVIAALQRNWMFFAMVVPGVLMSATYAMTSLMRHRAERAASSGASPDGANAVQPPSDSGGTSAFATPARLDTSTLSSLPVLSLPTSENGPGAETEYRPLSQNLWKFCVSEWERTGDTSPRHPTVRACMGVVATQNGKNKDPVPLSLDLCSRGPHALVAGTTGSGKSMFLQSWCVSMALQYPPDKVNFILLDFKGGATFRVLHRLPHVVGFVSDLNMAHAVRALRAIEAELKRRENLIAQAGVGSVDELDDPPPRLIIVVDEFHALRFALPDYSDHLVRIAAQGRSLAMHLILSTQNPQGQVSTDMKANINLNICLRVKDRLQSMEMLGTAQAAEFTASSPGMGILNDSESVRVFRAATIDDTELIVAHIYRCLRFYGGTPPSPLFTPPLPARLTREDIPLQSEHITAEPLIGCSDDGVLLHPCLLDLASGNLAIIGPDGRGKTTLLQNIGTQLRTISLQSRLRWTVKTDHGYLDHPGLPRQRALSSISHHLACDYWLIDGADELLDPLSRDKLHEEFMQALQMKSRRVLFTLTSARYVRYPDHCSLRIVFPSGEQTSDVMAGIPAPLLRQWAPEDYEIPGRGVCLSGSGARTIQCLEHQP
jgi:S-DNA-T family DNA segregation ATPase FtsK/SpoIIIE